MRSVSTDVLQAGSTASAISTSGGGETKNFDLRDESGPNPAYLLITGGESGTCVSWVATTACKADFVSADLHRNHPLTMPRSIGSEPGVHGW